ncbi:MAG TPA: hypothetical protein VKB88_35100 [Bryobacteraceae bacterium]|nr:hypothetical protein [Bryobacteraceae bacterium]
MVFFLSFLVLTTIVLPVVTLSLVGRLALSLAFALTLIFGASATSRHWAAIYLVIGLSIATFAMDLIIEIGRAHGLAGVDTAFRVASRRSSDATRLLTVRRQYGAIRKRY